jgi:hypothetical protein
MFNIIVGAGAAAIDAVNAILRFFITAAASWSHILLAYEWYTVYGILQSTYGNIWLVGDVTMAEQPSGPVADWELAKENIQPLKQGRKMAKLSTCLQVKSTGTSVYFWDTVYRYS